MYRLNFHDAKRRPSPRNPGPADDASGITASDAPSTATEPTENASGFGAPPPLHTERPAKDASGFCCAFYDNPRPCRWKPHGLTIHKFTSELKRFHQMHGLFYCGTCLSDFATEEEMTTHRQSSCTQYRCLAQDCPNFARLVTSGCPYHQRKNSQDEVYQYLCGLARAFREQQVPPSRENYTTFGSKASFTEALPSGETRRDASEWYHPRVHETSSLNAMASWSMDESTGVDTDIDDRVSRLESLISILWNKLEAGNTEVDMNLRKLYEQAIPDGEQNFMPVDYETPLHYRQRVLRNLARQLWDQLHGRTGIPLDELRTRVYDRIPQSQAQTLQPDVRPLPGLRGNEIDTEFLLSSYDDDALSKQYEPQSGLSGHELDSEAPDFAANDDIVSEHGEPESGLTGRGIDSEAFQLSADDNNLSNVDEPEPGLSGRKVGSETLLFPADDGNWPNMSEPAARASSANEDDVDLEPFHNASVSSSEASSARVSVFTRSVAASKATTQPTTMDSSTKPHSYPDPNSAEDMDADSVRTDGRDDGLDPETRAHFAALFATELLNNLETFDKTCWNVSALAALVFEYSSILEARAKHDHQKKAAIFVRHRRNMIAKLLQNPTEEGPSKQGLLPLKEKMAILMSKHGSEDMPTDIDLSGLRGDEDDPESSIPDFDRARAFLSEGVEFSWLTTRIKTAGSTAISGRDVFNKVRADLARAVLGRESLTLEVDWSPIAFLEEQYEAPDLPSFSEVVCVVGSGASTEATTCLEYVSRIWPTSGAQTLRMLDSIVHQRRDREPGSSQDSIRSEKQQYSVNYQPDPHETFRRYRSDAPSEEGAAQMQLEAEFVEGSTVFSAKSAVPIHLIEFGEVICWLAAACRASDCQSQMIYCAPNLSLDTATVKCSVLSVDDANPEEYQGAAESETCWHRMFNNASITCGYPIARRAPEEKGQQISLELMAALACTYRATMFRNHLLLKGLCSMFVPIIATGSSIVWHYLVNDDLTWMSSNVAWNDGRNVAKIDFSKLSDSKHFVGWTSHAKPVIGSTIASYDTIEYSQSPYVKAGFSFDGVTIGFSKIIELSTKISPGKKDTRIPGGWRGCYARTINIAALMNVVFYDVKMKRGWLVDGASALLLLGRACLTSPRAPGLEYTGSVSPSQQFIHADNSAPGSSTAKDILLNLANRKIILYVNETTPWVFEDLISQLFDVISDIKSLVPKLTSTNAGGWNIRSKHLSKFEGFDFIDIISGKINPRARFAKLESSGPNWMPLLQMSESVNILGSHFGELIRPSGHCRKQHVELPCGASLLAAPIERLRAIAGEFGEITNEYWKVMDGRCWNNPHESFPSSPCGCISNDPKTRCGRLITELQTKPKMNSQPKRRKLEDVMELYPAGAIIIGSSSAASKIYQGSQGTAQLSPIVPVRSIGSDSGLGLGSSLSSSSSRSPEYSM